MSFVMAYFCEALYLIRCSNPTVYMVPFIWPQNSRKKRDVRHVQLWIVHISVPRGQNERQLSCQGDRDTGASLA